MGVWLGIWVVMSDVHRNRFGDYSRCADVILRTGLCQVPLYKCTVTAKQFMCTTQLVPT